MTVNITTSDLKQLHYFDVTSINQVGIHTYEIIQRLGRVRVVEVISMRIHNNCLCHGN
jgi:hypothetical protein